MSLSLIGLFVATPEFVKVGNDGVVIPLRPGVIELTPNEVTSIMELVVKDLRYEAIQKTAQNHNLRLDPSLAESLKYPNGFKATFVPALDEYGQKRGYLIQSQEKWLFTVAPFPTGDGHLEGFVARLDSTGGAIVEEEEIAVQHEHSALETPLATTSSPYRNSCSYVKSFGINISCFDYEMNPFAYYYTQYYRSGYSTPPYSQWWTCYYGYPHSCPQVEDPGSPWTWNTCGVFAPSHPEG